ncbi:glycine-rich domain-containing protein [Aureivirga sp. CE67]|uniref:glycine-rich domain-containing protein n=1 Tax=Aureivirga sp. CE67 TaxID=1788983 RepID=UPI0018CAC5EE|nr:hypothetical protein [Aureivirga sp. CE67]
MTKEEKDLWKKIVDFELDDPDSDYNFTDKLCRENNWTYDFAIRAILEYKKFIFLVCISDFHLAPSDEVDQVWHLHLLYTYSYWTEMCKEILKREIHHGPTKGKNEKEHFTDLYEETKERYREVFKFEPPIDIWPSSQDRFHYIHFVRVNMHKNWVVPKKIFEKK